VNIPNEPLNIPNEPWRLPRTLPVLTAGGMRSLGRWLGESVLQAGDFVILSGPLGAGKTTLTQGIAEGLGVRGPITSPTFVIARVHPPLRGPDGPGIGAGPGLGEQRPALVHVDAYRLGSALELDDLDLDADLATSVTVVEWGEGLAEGLSSDRLEIALAPSSGAPGAAGGDGETWDGDIPRTVTMTGAGNRWQDVQLPPADVVDRL
jgi:tRNA threonylcarbamoyladenosine biosynthesis protein TsaE